MTLLKKYKWEIFSIIVIFFITMLFPYSGDDLSWGVNSLNNQLLHTLVSSTSLNGRYLGNIFVVIMCQNQILRGIIIAIVLTLIVYFISKETKTSKLIIWILILMMPLEMFRQTIPWSSGFTNYVISTLFLLGILITIRNLFYQKTRKTLLSLLGIIMIYCGCFFIENMTVFLVMLTLIVMIYYIIKNKKIKWSLILLFISSILGTITMFLQPSYLKVIDGTDGYRTYASNITELISRAFNNFTGTMYKYICFENLILIVFISILLFYYFYKNKNKYQVKQRKYIYFTFWYHLMFIVYALIASLNKDWQILLSKTSVFNSCLTILYIVSLIFLVVILFNKSKNFLKIIMPLVIIIGLILPLLVVYPIGARNFFMIYILEVIFAMYIFKETGHVIDKKMQLVLSTLLLILITYYISIYSVIFYVNKERNEYVLDIANNTDETAITVPLLPYSDYVWQGNFISDYLSNSYKRNLGIRSDITFEFVEYYIWKDIKDN